MRSPGAKREGERSPRCLCRCQAPLTHCEDSKACKDLLSQRTYLSAASGAPHTPALPRGPAWVLLRGGGSRRAGNSRLGWSQADQVRAGNSLLPPRSKPRLPSYSASPPGYPSPSDCSQPVLILQPLKVLFVSPPEPCPQSPSGSWLLNSSSLMGEAVHHHGGGG